jgi:hypothetical protein
VYSLAPAVPPGPSLQTCFIHASRITAAIRADIEALSRMIAAKWLADLQHLTKPTSEPMTVACRIHVVFVSFKNIAVSLS